MGNTRIAGKAPEAKRYVVFDLEATCWPRGREEAPSEIIEIGAVCFGMPGSQPVGGDEFQTFVRPFMAPRLSEFCTELTTIRQADVDGAPAFPKAIADFHRWAAGGGGYILAAWGNYDGAQIARDCGKHGIDNPFELVPYVNVKVAFAKHLKLRRSMGLDNALKKVGLRQEGTAHRAIDDARSVVRILQTGVAQAL
ncbi:exonuclease domain-containing protein [Pelagibius litoralis]|uniref:Exonuclease domain-containing protein n=1 Tax=Pelagibius litoralis TaxID=374515 RepID=A0A967EWZ1_9PROT|nr:3'-5' exonuclease [Pelagibius litoralis]NIA69033.1 exonuclease domain-containing protein [Pelagibius litoralis]